MTKYQQSECVPEVKIPSIFSIEIFIMSHKVANIQSRFRTSYSIMKCRKVFQWKPQVCMYIRLVLTETSFIVMLWNYFTHNPQSKQWWLWLVEVAVTIAMFKPHQMPEHQTSETVRAVITVRNKSLYQKPCNYAVVYYIYTTQTTKCPAI